MAGGSALPSYPYWHVCARGIKDSPSTDTPGGYQRGARGYVSGETQIRLLPVLPNHVSLLHNVAACPPFCHHSWLSQLRSTMPILHELTDFTETTCSDKKEAHTHCQTLTKLQHWGDCASSAHLHNGSTTSKEPQIMQTKGASGVRAIGITVGC